MPFLQEVKEAIYKAQAAFAYIRYRSILVINIRDKVLKVQNDLRSVRLAFETTEIKDNVLWCLKEIKKDIEASEPRDPGTSKVEKQSIDGLEGMHIENSLAALKQHEACSSAAFCASRSCFKLKRKDSLQKNFTVLGLSKKRKVFEAYMGHRGFTAGQRLPGPRERLQGNSRTGQRLAGWLPHGVCLDS